MSISPEAIQAIASRLFAIYVALTDRQGMLLCRTFQCSNKGDGF
jgi:hypothetical protein